MSKTLTVTLTEAEGKFLLGALDKVSLQGIGTARMLAVVAEKVARALSDDAASHGVDPSVAGDNGSAQPLESRTGRRA